ncbi:hypothetical protein P691DRAFT_39283 [Macrolepiota fuliginosa MF-IS2]|uniref:Uncharacterized protein n=1 Tax=Macrolepiota fuliginosa MF-IS2 TaxID=1400762 RepID=A0A9P5XCH6_9AGAR|nr:hypothetical protein P691DRAFT_39283 [Macrolepiota fuliginosa MF-IS2]
MRTNLYIINSPGPPLSLCQCTRAGCPFCGVGRRRKELAKPWHKQCHSCHVKHYVLTLHHRFHEGQIRSL